MSDEDHNYAFSYQRFDDQTNMPYIDTPHQETSEEITIEANIKDLQNQNDVLNNDRNINLSSIVASGDAPDTNSNQKSLNAAKQDEILITVNNQKIENLKKQGGTIHTNEVSKSNPRYGTTLRPPEPKQPIVYVPPKPPSGRKYNLSSSTTNGETRYYIDKHRVTQDNWLEAETYNNRLRPIKQ